jgi:heavy metal response regulator
MAQEMRILLVEDDTSLAGFIRKGLREEGYAVDLAQDGEEALLLASSAPYDLLILDVLLPELNGLGVCRKLRGQGSKTPILMLTAKESIEDKVSGFDAGADDYLTKPFAFSELVVRIRSLLRRGSSQPIGRLRVADLELDAVSHKVWRASQEITLTNKEYALLEYLMRNVDRVLTRTAIVEHIWDINYDSMTNIVDVHIRGLRAKIDHDFTPPLIHTIRGVGYMLETPKDVGDA